MNGITGANQNFDTYWQRVKIAFDEHKIVDPYFNKTVMVRGEKAMATHWGIMQAACSRWHDIQEEIADRLVSGADFECKVCLLAVSVGPGSPSFDSPDSLCRCGGRSTCTAMTQTTAVQVPQRLCPHRGLRKVGGSTPEPLQEQGRVVQSRCSSRCRIDGPPRARPKEAERTEEVGASSR
jgi:hypothetical protein